MSHCPDLLEQLCWRLPELIDLDFQGTQLNRVRDLGSAQCVVSDLRSAQCMVSDLESAQ